MSKQAKKTLVPKLRFPEFQKVGEWSIVPLKKLASRRTERNRDGDLTHVLTNSAEHGIVNQRDYFDKDIATQGNLENYFIVDKGDYVYNPRVSKFAPVGPISKNSVAKGVMSPLYTVFRFKNPDNEFYAHYFKSYAWHSYMRQVGSTGARHDRMAISNDDFIAMPLPVAVPEEQQKIADCLSSVGELITTQAQKVDALKAHKKGLMQQLFPAVGETVPKLRFPEFQDAGEWSEGTFDDLAATVMGNAFKSTDFVDSGIQLVRMGNLYQGELQLNRTPVFLPKTFVEEFPRFLIKPLDLLMSMTGTMGKQDYGFVVQVPMNSNALLLNQRVVKINPKKSCIKEFLLQLLKSETLLSELYSLPGGTKQANLSAQQLRGLEVKFPEKPEQQKIADCLSSIDEMITAQTQKLNALKVHKKGLMQQLFPANDEVGA